MGANTHTIKLYWEQVKKHRTSALVSLFSIPAAQILISTALPYYFSQAIGALVQGDTISTYAALVTASIVGLTGVAFNFLGFQAMVYHESRIISLLRNQTLQSLLSKDLRFFVDQKIGSLTSKYVDFIRSHIILQDLLIIRTIGLVISLTLGLALIASQSLLVAFIILVLILILIAQVRWSLRKRAPHRKERVKLRSEIHARVADGLTNSLIVKTFGGESRELKEVRSLGKRFDIAYRKDFGFISAEGSTRVLLMVVTQLIAIYVSASLVAQKQIDIPTVIFCLTYLQLVGSQIFAIGDILNGYEESLLEASPMSEMLMQETIVNDKNDAKTLEDITPTIQLKDVSYGYSDSNEHVLRGIDLSIAPGQKVGLVGHSGAGKSTLTHLLLRFSDITNGAILIDGHDIRDVTQQSLRQHISYVPQEPMLFHRSLRDNIAYGRPDATDDEVLKAAKQAHALEFIEKLPNGFETTVGERGVKLSGGQRQRIAIARALLKDAPILILDEATSALDSESERLIQASLTELMKGRTAIVIAHRLSTIQKMDRIIVLEGGKVIEDGTHTELLTHKGTYARLWAHQSGGFIEE